MIVIYLLFALFSIYNIGFFLLKFFNLDVEPRLYFVGLHSLLSPAAFLYFKRQQPQVPLGIASLKRWWRVWFPWLPGLVVTLANLVVLALGIAAGRTPDFMSWVFVLVVIWVPIAEEIVFRMGILTALARRFRNPAMIVYLGALIFMLVHGTLSASGLYVPSLHPAGGAFLLGLLTGFIFIESRQQLAPAIFLHAACNATGYIFPWFSPDLIEPIRWLYQ